MTCEMQTNAQTNNNHSKQNIDNLETDGWGLMACLQEQVQLPLQMEGLNLSNNLKVRLKILIKTFQSSASKISSKFLGPVPLDR